MKLRSCWGLSLRLLFSSGYSHAQGAAESVLTNALSSSTTAKAGSALNHALSQSTTQLGLRIQERTASPVRVGVPQGAPRMAMKSATAGNPSRAAIRAGSLPALGGISVQGGETACTSVSPPNLASPANPTPANTVLAESMPRTAPPQLIAADANPRATPGREISTSHSSRYPSQSKSVHSTLIYVPVPVRRRRPAGDGFVQRRRVLLGRDAEIHRYASLSRNGLPAFVVRFEVPLLDRFQRGGSQHGRTADHFESVNGPIFPDPGLENYRSFHIGLLRQ